MILSLTGICTDACKLAYFDFPTRDNIHRYWCNNPILFHPMNTKSSIYTSGITMRENTTFDVHEWNKIWSYTEKIKFSVSYMLQNCINSAHFNVSPTTTEMIFFLIPFTSIWWLSACLITGYNTGNKPSLHLENYIFLNGSLWNINVSYTVSLKESIIFVIFTVYRFLFHWGISIFYRKAYKKIKYLTTMKIWNFRHLKNCCNYPKFNQYVCTIG